MDKISYLSLILFLVLLVIFVVKLFFFWRGGGLVYFVLDFRSINFFMVTKMRKILELQVFFINYLCNNWLLVSKKNNVSGVPICKPIRIYYKKDL